MTQVEKFNRFLDWLSDYFSARKGLLPILGVVLVLVNFVLQFFLTGWIAESNLFLHLGIVLAILGILLAWAL